MSGTGKTQLALLYAEALQMKLGKNLLFVPVKPSYTEPSDLFGYFNPQTRTYMESEVGLVSFLDRASRHPDEMHMVVFDEMNLGQVEHYFSDFISILELEPSKRLLRLHHEKPNFQVSQKDAIPILNNVLFVGTANFDETTRDFSNRMLDRSNVILLEKHTFLEAKKYEEENVDNADEYEKQEKNPLDLEKNVTADNYKSWVKIKRDFSALEDTELLILDQLHEEISNFDSQTGVSFRIAKQIGHYLDNIPKDEHDNTLISRTRAFDYQIKQRVLTKVRGHREQIGHLVGKYEDKYQNGRLAYVLEDNESYDFEKSLRYLAQKAKELMRNGYTL